MIRNANMQNCWLKNKIRFLFYRIRSISLINVLVLVVLVTSINYLIEKHLKSNVSEKSPVISNIVDDLKQQKSAQSIPTISAKINTLKCSNNVILKNGKL